MEILRTIFIEDMEQIFKIRPLMDGNSVSSVIFPALISLFFKIRPLMDGNRIEQNFERFD